MSKEERQISKMFRVPDAVIGVRVVWWRRIIQRFTRRP